MKNYISKKVLYCMFLFILILGYFAIKPTSAKFSHDYTTENDAVGFSFHFDIGISDFLEYEEVKIESNSYEVFDVNIANSTTDTVSYGIWYKMMSPKEITNDIMIGRLEDNFTSMSGKLESLEDKTASIIIKNNSINDIIIAIGVISSPGDEELEYLNGKHLITGSYKEVDYIYENSSKKYISSIDNNSYFLLNSTKYDSSNETNIYTVPHKGVFKIEAWGASNTDKLGDYTSGIISLEQDDKLYLSLGLKDSDNNATDIRLIEDNLASRIMIASTGSLSYISGHYGSLASTIVDNELREKCITGMEDISCSYHSSSIIFDETTLISGNNEMPSPENNENIIGNVGNGHIRITPIVPTITIPELKVKIGDQLDTSNVNCTDSLGGCHLVRISPEDTTNLEVGKHPISFMVSDDYGNVYKYSSEFNITE